MAENPRAVAEAVVAKLDDGGSGMIASKPACAPPFSLSISSFLQPLLLILAGS